MGVLALRAPRPEGRIMQSHTFPLADAHASIGRFLLQLCQKIGLVPAPAVRDRISRRHRAMRIVDERRGGVRERGSQASGLIPPEVSAVSKPTYFGSFCSSLVATENGNHEQTEVHDSERRARDTRIAARLPNAQQHLRPEQQHREHVRSCGLDGRQAMTRMDARQRQVALLQRLAQIVE